MLNHFFGEFRWRSTQHQPIQIPLTVPSRILSRLAGTPTRLKRLPEKRQQQRMNWGYAVCDAAVRRHADVLVAQGSPDAKFPFESAGLSESLPQIMTDRQQFMR